jgi:restriction system protein
VVSSERATRAIFVTTGTFTEAARAFAADKALELIDGSGLARLLEAAGHNPESVMTAPIAASGAVVCPRCGRPMVRRIARRGPNAGQAFWGCGDYPQCRGTLPISD